LPRHSFRLPRKRTNHRELRQNKTHRYNLGFPAQKKTVPLSGVSQPAIVHYAPAPSGAKKWYIQLGAFSIREYADKLVSDFKNKGVQLYIVELADRKLFTVRTGDFISREDAENYAQQKITPTHRDYKILQ